MPATSNGTPYTVRTVDLPGHGKVVWAVADALVAATDIPFVLYAHGSGGSYNQFAALPAWSGMRDWLIDNGWGWVEGTGGGTGSWGNTQAQDDYMAYLDHLDGQVDVGQLVLLGRSMGGLVTAWLYAMSPIKDRFSGWINNSGVSTMFVGNDAGTSSQWTTSRQWRDAIYGAYGVTNDAQLAAFGHAPESWNASVWTGKKILACYGTADYTVPWYPRGASTLRGIWAGLPDVDEISVRTGGDHSASNGSYLDVPAMSAFLASIGGGAVPPASRIGWRIRQAWTVLSGKRYSIDFRP